MVDVLGIPSPLLPPSGAASPLDTFQRDGSWPGQASQSLPWDAHVPRCTQASGSHLLCLGLLAGVRHCCSCDCGHPPPSRCSRKGGGSCTREARQGGEPHGESVLTLLSEPEPEQSSWPVLPGAGASPSPPLPRPVSAGVLPLKFRLPQCNTSVLPPAKGQCARPVFSRVNLTARVSW